MNKKFFSAYLDKLDFLYKTPTYPDAIIQPAPKDKLKTKYDTNWARSYWARKSREILIDFIFRPAVRLTAAPKIEGLFHLNNLDGPAIFVANHQSHLDTPLILSCLPSEIRRNLVVAAAADYFFDTYPKAVLSSYLLNAIPMERVKINRASAYLGQHLIEDGWNLLIYPEGTRSTDGWGGPWKGGAFYLSVKTNRPVVPIYIYGTSRLLAKGSKKLVTGSTYVSFLRPVQPLKNEDARRFAQRVEALVARTKDEFHNGFWQAAKNFYAGNTIPLEGPSVSPWRRSWLKSSLTPAKDSKEKSWPYEK
jgi:1-acyl-sn-glycerol-3-phosphate acyltransferase